MEESRRALRTRWQGDVPVAQLLLEHRDRRPGIAVLALGDCDGGRVANREAAHHPKGLLPEYLDERLAIGLIADWRLGVATRSEAHAGDQGGDHGGKK